MVLLGKNAFEPIFNSILMGIVYGESYLQNAMLNLFRDIIKLSNKSFNVIPIEREGQKIIPATHQLILSNQIIKKLEALPTSTITSRKLWFEICMELFVFFIKCKSKFSDLITCDYKFEK
jgi:hypothetical protein